MGRRLAALVALVALTVGLGVLLEALWPDLGDPPNTYRFGKAGDTAQRPRPASVAPARGEGRPAGTPAGRLDVAPRRHAAPRPGTPPASEPEPVAPAAPPPAIHGVVTTDDWFRVPGAEVLLTLDRPEREGDALRLTGRVIGSARTDRDGRFAFATAPDGEFFLTVCGATHPEGGALSDAVVPAQAGGDEVTIRVLGRPGVWVRVVDPEGRPLVGADVAVRPPHGTPWRVTCDDDGWARLPLARAPDPAEMRLSVRPPADRTDLETLWDVPFGASVLVPGAPSVAGLVEDAAGRPVPGARVHARNVAWPGDRVVKAAARGDGRFAVGQIGEGAVEIWATPPGGSALTEAWERRTVEVGATQVRLPLPPVADLTVIVEGTDEPVFVAARPQTAGPARLTPRMRRAPGDWDSVAYEVRRSDDTGRVVFPALPSAGPYVLWMFPDGEGRTFVRPDVRAGGPEVRVRAEPGRPTHVRVDPPTLSWIVGAWAVDDHGALFELDRRRGAQWFPALPPGRWHVVAVVENRQHVRGAERDWPKEILEADVTAGEDLVLVPVGR